VGEGGGANPLFLLERKKGKPRSFLLARPTTATRQEGEKRIRKVFSSPFHSHDKRGKKRVRDIDNSLPLPLAGEHRGREEGKGKSGGD